MARVLEINATYNKGSTGVLMNQIGTVLTEKGVEVYYATPDAPATEFTYRIGHKVEQKLHAALSRVVGVQGYFSTVSTWKLINWINRIRPDIVHVHNLHSNYINYVMLFRYLKKKHIDTVITLHDCWFFTGKCFHFLYDNCGRWKEHCGFCPRKHAEQNSIIFDFSRKVLADKKRLIGENEKIRVVAVSEWMALQARESILKKRPIIIIRNGINLNVFQPQKINRKEKNIPNDKFIILTMANKWFAPENNQVREELLKRLEDGMHVVVIGCSGIKPQYNPRVTYLEHLDAQELAQYYSLADVFVNLTKVDTYPTVNMEAIACGTPVVSFDSGGSRESIVEGVTGHVVPYGDVQLLVDRIEGIRRLGKAAYSEHCLEIARKQFDKDICFAEYWDLIRNILQDVQ